MTDGVQPPDTEPGPSQPQRARARSRRGAALRLLLEGKGAARRRAVDVMLGQSRALVAEEIATAILDSQHPAGPSADPLQRARGEQARMDAATARRIGNRSAS
jgi:hypothetical protein